MNGIVDYCTDLWKFRYLIVHMANSDLRARFRRSRIGILWAMLQPMLLASLFAFVLARLFHQPFRDFAVYVFSGVVMWEFFTGAAGQGAAALLNAEGYLKQNKMPLMVFQFRLLLNLLIINLLGTAGFALFCIFVKPEIFSIYWLYLPLWLVVMMIFAMPVLIISSIVNVLYRDFQQALGLILTAVWYVSPVFLAREVFFTPGLAQFTRINPIASLCDLLRDPLVYQQNPSLYDLGLVAIWTVALWVWAIILQARYERQLIYRF